MSKRPIFVSATIVLFLCGTTVGAAPLEEMPPASAQEPETHPRKLDDDLTISQPPEAPAQTILPNPRYYPYKQALTFRAGLSSDELGNFKEENYILGFQYLFPKFLSPKIEAGADVHQDGVGHLHAGIRYIAFQKAYFRPSAKFGLDHRFEGDQGLATFGTLKNYYARISLTLESVLWNPFSVRLEGEVLMNTSGEDESVVTLGLNRGW